MKAFFSKERNEQYKNRSKQYFVIYALWAAAFLVAITQSAEAQRPGNRDQGPRIPIATGGKFSDIQVDGDRVKILATDGGKPGKIQIRLDADGTWWKMLRVFDKNGRANYIEQEGGRYINNKDVIEIDSSNLDATFKLEFWKAKFLGVHTHMMTEIYRKQDFEGRVVKFIWKQGLEGPDSDLAPDPIAPIAETLKIEGKNVSIRSSDDGRKGYATFKFQTTVDWWTAVKVFDRSGKARQIQKVNGVYSPKDGVMAIPISAFPSEINIEFWTAKFLGVHTHMASKKLIRERFDGRVVTINWPK
jgi:hypothetical protein